MIQSQIGVAFVSDIRKSAELLGSRRDFVVKKRVKRILCL